MRARAFSLLPLSLLLAAASVQGQDVLVLTSAPMELGRGAELMPRPSSFRAGAEERLGAAVGEVSAIEVDAYLQEHNAYRRSVSPPAAAPLKDLAWDAALAGSAYDWARQCTWGHYVDGSYGQNLYAAAGSSPSFSVTPGTAVKGWGDEKAFYSLASNSCAEGKVCGHYTQVVWASTDRVGCSKQRCTSGSPFTSLATWWIVVCNYGPPGNYVGVRPYVAAAQATSAAPSSALSHAPFTLTPDPLLSAPTHRPSKHPVTRKPTKAPSVRPSGTSPTARPTLSSTLVSSVNAEVFVATHNRYRDATTAGLVSMHWDESLASLASRWVANCTFKIDPSTYANRVGQNVYAAVAFSSPAQAVSTRLSTNDAYSFITLHLAEQVDFWVGQGGNYDYATNTCSAACAAYKQVVLRTTSAVGCFTQTCSTGSPFGTGFPAWYWTACNYAPAGNLGAQPY